MRRLLILSLIFLTGCVSAYKKKAIIKVYPEKVEFWSQSDEFQAKIKQDKVEAEYNSQKPSLFDEIIKVWVIKQMGD